MTNPDDCHSALFAGFRAFRGRSGRAVLVISASVRREYAKCKTGHHMGLTSQASNRKVTAAFLTTLMDTAAVGVLYLAWKVSARIYT